MADPWLKRLLPQLQQLVRWDSAMDPAIILLTGFRTTSVRLSASVTVLRDFRRKKRPCGLGEQHVGAITDCSCDCNGVVPLTVWSV